MPAPQRSAEVPLPMPQRRNVPDAEKIKDDVWGSNPPQVTSFIACPRSGAPGRDPVITYTSPICGFGWRFQLRESYYFQESKGNSLVQELVGRRALIFQPHICSSMPLSKVKVMLKASYPDAGATSNSSQERVFSNVAIQSPEASDIGTYDEPPQYRGRAHFQITIAFDPSDKLSLPNSSSSNTKKALRHSLDALSFIDTKFYLFSKRVNSRPACPEVVYAKSELLETSSPFLKDLLSEETGFTSGTPCDLSEDVPEELNKLDEGTFEYDSDSDLEDDEPELVGKGKGKDSGSEEKDSGFGEKSGAVLTQANDKLASQYPVNGRAFAINGTAYKTWKAFIYYTYTGDIVFNRLKSFRELGFFETKPVAKTDLDDIDPVSCSPKSMYRFADYADIPALKSLAKEGIRKSLSKSNIIDELFSSFTHKYQEVIELEVDFLVANFTPGVARRLDEMLEMIVLGNKPRSFRVLAFTMRRLRGDSRDRAWSALEPASISVMEGAILGPSQVPSATSRSPRTYSRLSSISPTPAMPRFRSPGANDSRPPSSYPSPRAISPVQNPKVRAPDESGSEWPAGWLIEKPNRARRGY